MINSSNLNTALNVMAAFLKLLGELTWELLLLLFASNEEPSNNKATENAAQGGILNYRTGQFDDGTDPAGWYEKD